MGRGPLPAAAGGEIYSLKGGPMAPRVGATIAAPPAAEGDRGEGGGKDGPAAWGDEEEANAAVRSERCTEEEAEQLERRALVAGLPASGPAQPQRVKIDGMWRDVWPHQWGMTLGQFRHLMEEARVDKEKPLSPDANVHTLVQDYIVPKTSKKGVGYALLMNEARPREANVMISHAWSENAELFFRRLERSVSEDDVMFICAFSLYQCEDGYGPSILQQLGVTAAESPFRKVLEHIQHKGQLHRPMTTLRPFLAKLPYVMFAGTLSFYSLYIIHLGCIPRLDECHYFVLDLERPLPELTGGLTWHRKPVEGSAFFVVPLVIAVGLAAVLIQLALMRWKIYYGYMLAVPNRNCDLYSRLWCVYEIFVATQMKVPVVLARTFVRAGFDEGGSPSRAATCCCSEDMDRIRGEIEVWGERVMGSPELGYDLVDRAIHWTTRDAKRQIILVVLLFLWPLSMFNVIRSALIRDKINLGYGHIANFLGLLCAALMSTYVAFKWVKRNQGRPTARVMAGGGSLLLLFGVAVNRATAELFSSPGSDASQVEVFAHEFLLEFTSFAAWCGAVFVLLTIGAKTLPEWVVRIPERRNIGFELALGAIVVFSTSWFCETIFGDRVPVGAVYAYLFAPVVTLPMVIWHIAVQWGVSLARNTSCLEARAPKPPAASPGSP